MPNDIGLERDLVKPQTESRQTRPSLEQCLREPDKIEQRKHGSRIFPIDCHHWNSFKGPCYNLWHWHHEVEICHALAGKDIFVEFTDHTVRLDAPAIFLIGGGIPHRIEFNGDCPIDPEGAEHFEDIAANNPANLGKVNHTLFDTAALELSRFDEAQSSMLEALDKGVISMTQPIRPNDPGFDELNTLLDFVGRYSKHKDAGMRLQVKGCLLQVLGVLYSHGYLNKTPIKRSKRSNSREERIKELFTYIGDNYNHPLSIVDVASRINVSKQYFCRLFKKLTNMSFVEYLNVIRLSRAAQEIILSSDPINDIAERHGFDSISYFFKLFKQNFHCTPNTFRQNKGMVGDQHQPVDLILENIRPMSEQSIQIHEQLKEEQHQRKNKSKAS